MESESQNKGDIGHTSLVFFHGIGNPRKHGSLSRFLDSLDEYGSKQNRQTLGVPRNFKPRTEIEEDGSIRTFFQFRRIKSFKKRDVQVKIVRAYEGYWGDDPTEKLSIFSFFIWSLSVVYNVIRMLSSEWRRYPLHRIRSISLINDCFEGEKSREKLEKLYRKFNRAEERKKYPEGSYSDFVQMLGEPNVLKSYGDFRDLSEKWRQRENKFLKERLLKFAAVFIWGFIMVAFVFFTIQFALELILSSSATLSSYAGMMSVPLTLLVLHVAWLPVRRRISDVAAWTTYDESEAKHAIRQRRLETAEDLIWKVISDEKCNDCVVVAHSLGSAIAMEALGRAVSRVKAVNITSRERKKMTENLQKIKFLFLAGSPIDNIFSLFQDDRDYSRRYSRLQEQQALSLDNFLYRDREKDMGATVVNFWSRFDPISARIYSLISPSNHKRNIIFNSECLPQGMPRPLASHSGYFSDEAVIGAIYDAVMIGRVATGKLKPEYLPISNGRWTKIGYLSACVSVLALVVSATFLSPGFLLASMALCLVVSVAFVWKFSSELNRQNT